MATKVVMEALSPTMEEGRLVKWNKNEGDQIKSGDVLAEVETDKAELELVAGGDGVLRKRLGDDGDAAAAGASRPGAAAGGGRQRTSPRARRLANERGIQLGGLQGTGPGGRIVKRDVENAKAAGAGAGRSAAAERLAAEGDFKDVALTQIRK